uniref:Uncharacterized protein n=1 Tax=Arundo donax TaxID=35708 RepID=A0A0A9BSI2_ARUDO
MHILISKTKRKEYFIFWTYYQRKQLKEIEW